MLRSKSLLLFAVATIGIFLTPTLFAQGWRFDGTGRFPNVNPVLRWGKEENVAWKVKLPGRGLASPIVVDDMVFLATDPAVLHCFRLKDGKEIWQRSHEYANVFGDKKGAEIEANLEEAKTVRKQRDELGRERNAARKAENTAEAERLQKQIEKLDDRYRTLTVYPPKPGGDTANSTSTPVSDQANVFAVFATGVVSSHTINGEQNWMVFLDGARGDHSASPLLIEDKLIVHLQDLFALDAQTGKVLWRTKTDERHGSEVVTKVDGQHVLITANGDLIRVSDGEMVAKNLFRLGHNSPIVEDGSIYAVEDGVIKSLQLPTKLQDIEKLKTQWEAKTSRANQLASPILHEGLLYAVSEQGILDVVDADSGKRVYRKRLEFEGGRIDGSLCFAGGLLFVSNTRGVTLILRPGLEFEEVARNESDGFSSSLAFAKNRILIHTREHLICIGE